ncbi:unnamed protein product, partial [Ectocarpus sp. 8 AP-2014]
RYCNWRFSLGGSRYFVCWRYFSGGTAIWRFFSGSSRYFVFWRYRLGRFPVQPNVVVITASTGTAHHGGKKTAGIFPRCTLIFLFVSREEIVFNLEAPAAYISGSSRV